MRARILHVTAQMFIELCKASKSGPARRFEVVENPLPDDAEVAGIYGEYSTLRLVIHSETYDDLEWGELPTIVPPVYRTVFDDD